MQKIKSETFIFCFGARGKNGLHARLLRGIRPEGVEIARKTVRFSLATCPFFPVGLLKNECGAWLKNPVSRGGSFCFFVFSRPRLTERKRSASENRVNPFPRVGKKEVRADRYPSRTSGDETQGGGCYGVISPVAIKFPSE